MRFQTKLRIRSGSMLKKVIDDEDDVTPANKPFIGLFSRSRSKIAHDNAPLAQNNAPLIHDNLPLAHDNASLVSIMRR